MVFLATSAGKDSAAAVETLETDDLSVVMTQLAFLAAVGIEAREEALSEDSEQVVTD